MKLTWAWLTDIEGVLEDIGRDYKELVDSIEDSSARSQTVTAYFNFTRDQRKEIQGAKTLLEGLEVHSAQVSRQASWAGSCVPDRSARVQNPFKKLDPPVFSGEVEDYAKYKQLQLTANLRFTQEILLEHLKVGLNKASKDVIKDCTNVDEA